MMQITILSMNYIGVISSYFGQIFRQYVDIIRGSPNFDYLVLQGIS